MQLTPEVKRALRRKRADMNLTRYEVADKLELSRRQYAKFEKDEYTADVRNGTFKKLAEWLAKDY
jgi:Helix-turn-helix.